MAETLLQQAFDESREKLIAAICKLKRAKRLEYVESDGNQYVDTGWIPVSDYARIEFEFTPTASLARKAVCGSEQNTDAGVCRWLFVLFGQARTVSRQYPLIRNWNNSSEFFDCAVGERRHIVWTSDAGEDSISETVTGWSVTHTTSSVPLTTHRSSLKLFQNFSTQRSSIQLAFFKIWDNGALARDYIPVKDSAGVAGLLDLVSGQIFYSATSTQLLAGPEATPYFSRIEYLESTGTQYIDAGVSVALRTTDVSFSVGVLFTQNGRMLIGANSSPIVGRSASGTLDGTSTAISLNTWYDLEVRHDHSTGTYGGRSFYVDGAFVYGQEFQTERTSLPQKFAIFNIFFADNSSIASYWMKGRVSWAKISVDGTLVRDFIPVRIGQVGYLFDRVSKQFFSNKGTGNFVLGPDVA